MTARSRSLSQTGPSAVLARIERAVRCTEGFRLSFVRCDDPVLEEKAWSQLLARLRGKRVLEVRLETTVESLLSELTGRISPGSIPAAVLVRGLELSIPAEDAPLLPRLEAELDALRSSVPGMLLIWLPGAVLDRIRREAPLLWQEGSPHYELIAPGALRTPAPSAVPEPLRAAAPAVEPAAVVADEEAALVAEAEAAPVEAETPLEAEAPPEPEAAEPSPVPETRPAVPRPEPEERGPGGLPPLHTLSLAQKQAEIDLRLSRLRDAVQEAVAGGVEPGRTQAQLLYEIGLLYTSLAEWGRAAAALEESAALFNIVADPRARGAALLHLGITRHNQGRLDDALGLYELSLRLVPASEDRRSAGVALHQMGMVEQARGRAEAALARFEESLALKREIGDRRGIAATLHQMGALRQKQRDLAAAVRLYEESLQIKRELDDRPGIAATLHQLGTAEHQQGRLDEAMRYYDESLRIKKAVGDRAGTAVTLGQIGRIHQQRNHLREALQHYTTSWLMFRSLQSPYAELAQKLIRGIHAQAGREQFEAWLKGDLRALAAQIRKALADETEER